MTKQFAPLCLNNDTGRALVNSNHILPCCFMDWTYRNKLETLPEVYQHLVDEELKISNINDIEQDLFQSKQWKEFMQYMKDAADGKIQCNVKECNEYCTKDFDADPTAKRQVVNNVL